MIYANKLSQEIAIGAMDERITLKRETGTVTNDLGEVTAIESEDTVLYAYVKYDIDDEQELENKQTVMDYREFVTRYKVCDVEDRVLYEGKTYDIIKVETMGRKRYMRLRCKLAR
jgi:SPP1 family predicted phage head-tail adaptor